MPKPQQTHGLFAVLSIILFAGLPLYIGIRDVHQYMTVHPSSYVPAGWTTTTGRVVQTHIGYGRIAYTVPDVRFVDRHGVPHTFAAAREYTTYGSSRVGQTVRVAYSPTDPTRALFVDEPGSVRVPSLMGGIFLLVLASVVIVIVVGVALKSLAGRLFNPPPIGTRALTGPTSPIWPPGIFLLAPAGIVRCRCWASFCLSCLRCLQWRSRYIWASRRCSNMPL